MALLKISNLNKSFTSHPTQNSNYVLRNVNASFPSCGLISILGKSGCGKSTLLHCIGLLGNVTDGSVLYNEKDITKYNENKKREYLNRDVSFVFQHYQLIEDYSVIHNVALPLLISGVKKKTAYYQAEIILKEMGFDMVFCKKKASDCSGGEKQRVAIARAIITNPKILLADEPTGALDTNNSIVVLDILKKYSENHLVLLVTHNLEIADQYSNRIITLQDGLIVNDINKSYIVEKKQIEDNYKYKNSSNWTDDFIDKNLKKRFKRNFISSISLGFCVVFSFLLVGFISGAPKVIDSECAKHYDAGVSSVSVQESQHIEKTNISLVKESRPSNKQILKLINDYDYLSYGYNYSSIVPEAINVTYHKENIETISYSPVYSFLENYNPNLLVKGRLPNEDCLEEVVINQKAYKLLFDITKKEVINTKMDLHHEREITTYLNDEITPYVIDYFQFNKSVKIIGVVDELDFLSTPKIYYSYHALDNYLNEYLMSNLSNYYNETITIKDKVESVSNDDELSGYSYLLFLENYTYYQDFKNIQCDLVINNNARTIETALSSFIDAASMGIEIFLIIAIISSVLILGITAYASYSQDRHQNAILLSLGAKRDHIFLIYVMESLVLATVSFIVSVAISLGFQPLFNTVIFKFTNLQNLVQIPLKMFLNRPFLLPIIAFLITMIICVLATYLPLAFSKKTNLSEELKEE